MKNYFVFAMILIASVTAYPQATRTAKETKSERSGTKKEATQRTTTRTENKSVRSAVKVEKQSTATSGSVRTRPSVETRSYQRPRTETKSTEHQKVETKSTERPRVESRSYQRPQETRNNTQSARSRNENVRTNSDGARRTQETVRPQANAGKRSESGNSVRNTERSGSNSSASRIYREGKGTLTRDDGTVIRHQNDEIFTSRKYKLDYDNFENLRRSDEFNRDHRNYNDWYGRRRIRIYNHNDYNFISMPWELRRAQYYYRAPHHLDLIWTPLLFHRFMYYYPAQLDWNIEFGNQIETISAYEAKNYAGTVRQVYGKVDEVYYSPEDENYILYVGGVFPYHDLSIVIPKDIAKNISMSPKWYFDKEFVWVIGLINVWEEKPEIIVRDEDQIRKY